MPAVLCALEAHLLVVERVAGVLVALLDALDTRQLVAILVRDNVVFELLHPLIVCLLSSFLSLAPTLLSMAKCLSVSCETQSSWR